VLYFKVTDDAVTETEDHREGQSRWDWHKMEQADFDALVARANETAGYVKYVGTFSNNVSPCRDIVTLPVVGDDVSYGFNGDFYPCGHITNISKSLRIITTSSGKKFWRKRQTGSWLNDGMWSLVRGTHNDRNPEF